MFLILTIVLALASQDQVSASCLVETNDGTCCHFPFYYRGKAYYKCIVGNAGKPWCAYDADYIQSRWGYCKGTGIPQTSSPPFQIEDADTGYCVGYGNNNLKTAPCSTNDASQRWEWYAYYKLKNGASGDCLSVSSDGTNALKMVPCDTSQDWNCNNNYYRPGLKTKNPKDGAEQCLQVQKDLSATLVACDKKQLGQSLKLHNTKYGAVCGIRDNVGNLTRDKSYYLLKSSHFHLGWSEKYVRVFLVFNIDTFNNYLAKYGNEASALKAIETTAIEAMTILDKAYRMIRIRVLLAGYEVWNSKEKINVTTDYYVLKQQFRLYSHNILRAKYQFESAVFIYGRSWSGSWGGAGMGDMCRSQDDPNNEIFIMTMRKGTSSLNLANILSHEMGHQFYMGHSFEPAAPCPTHRLFGKFCTMGGNSWPKGFSADFLSNIRRYKLTCLDSKPKQSNIHACGNGVIDTGEECDCGSSEACLKTDPCCDGSICKLREGAECSSETCCNQCKYDASKQGCEGTVVHLTDEKGKISEESPRTNVHKHWSIKVPAGKVVSLIIVTAHFDWGLDCPYDYLQVRDGGSSSKVLDKICLPENVKRLRTTSNEAFITYHSDGTFGGKFDIYYEAVNKDNIDCYYETTTGDCCNIPFVYKDVTYYSCTLKGEPKPWCSLTPKYEGTWGFCQIPPGTDVLKEQCKVKTVNGNCCVFPFTYKGKKYTSCQPYAGKTWCSTTAVYEGSWGYCKTSS